MAARGSMTGRWQQILRLMDEAYADYLTGMAALRERVVVDLKRKLSDRQVLDRARRGARSRSAPARKRGRKRRRTCLPRRCSSPRSEERRVGKEGRSRWL